MLEFLFGDGSVQLAIAPFIIPAALSAGQILLSLLSRPKKPKMPDIEGNYGLTPEAEQAMMNLVKQRIGEGTQGALKQVQSSALRRGFYRSGQLPALEADVQASGQKALSEAVASLEMDKANRRERYANMLMSRYMSDLSGYYQGEQSAGAGVGSALGNLLNLFMMYGNQGGMGGNGGMGIRGGWKTPNYSSLYKQPNFRKY